MKRECDPAILIDVMIKTTAPPKEALEGNDVWAPRVQRWICGFLIHWCAGRGRRLPLLLAGTTACRVRVPMACRGVFFSDVRV